MKRLIFTCVALVTLSSLFSQADKEDLGLRFGMQLTPTISWFTSDEVDLVDPQGAIMGYSFGIVGDWFFNKNYALSTGCYMNSMGGKLTYGESMNLQTKNSGLHSSVDDVTLRPTYLELPLGFKFLTKEFWRVRFVGQAGFNQFILLNATVRQNEELDKKDVSAEFTSVMSAYHFGFGAEYSLGGEAYLTASLLGTFGLNDVTKSVSNIDNVDPINKLNSINFKIGVIF